jgi:hypothetical protein
MPFCAIEENSSQGVSSPTMIIRVPRVPVPSSLIYNSFCSLKPKVFLLSFIFLRTIGEVSSELLLHITTVMIRIQTLTKNHY